MQLGELLRSSVVDRDGEDLGRVEDVRLVQDGPNVEGFGNALRLDGLIVGGGGLAARLGYHRRGVRGPAPLRWIFGALERRARYVPWSDVDRCEDRTLVLKVAASEVPGIVDAGLD
jgi:sporulation protein YlmC with PRC-barrel domain